MEDLIGILLEVVGEFLLEIVGAALDDLISRSTAEALNFPTISSPSLAALGYLVFGALTGGVSLLLFPHPIFQPSRHRGISLVISPWLTGGFMAMVGKYIRERGHETARIESFAYGFVFAFGMAAVRFWFAL